MKTPLYVVKSDFALRDGFVLKKGTLVHRIDRYNLPKHIIDAHYWDYMDVDKITFCYTVKGIIALPSHIVEKYD